MKLIESTIKIIVVAIILITNISDSPGGEPNQPAPDDISAYYGFKEMEIIKLNWQITCLRIADFNGDGRNDIAVANNLKSRLELLIQKEAVTVPQKTVSPDADDIEVNAIFDDLPGRFEKQSIPISQKVYSFVTGDLNSDGLTDLVFYGEPKGLYVILQKALDKEKDGDKNIKWKTSKKIKIDDALLTTSSLVCDDLNNDGADDLVLAARDHTYLIIQKDDGSLAEPAKYPTTALTRGVAVGDLNNDNINDLMLVTNDTEKPIHVRFGLKTGQLGPQLEFFIESPWVLDLHNIDAQTGDEIITVDARSGRLICYKLADRTQNDDDWPILLFPLPSGEQSSRRDLVVADFDGDKLDDVVISDPGAAELIFYKQADALGLTEPVRFPAYADIDNLSAAVITRKNKKQTVLAVLSIKEKTIGLSSFENDRLSFPKPLDIEGEPVAMELDDIDNNSNTDCIYISKDSNNIRSLRAIYNLNKIDKPQPLFSFGKGKNKQDTSLLLQIDKLTSNPDGLKILDVDQDGLKDILVFVKYELPLLVRQTTKGKFQLIDSPKAQAGLIKDAAVTSIAVADVDEKKGDELLIAQRNFARSLVFQDSKRWTVIDQYNAKSTHNNIAAVAAFDIYNTGSKPQILLLDGQKQRLQILTAGPDKTYRFEKELQVGSWNQANHLKCLFAALTPTHTKSILLFDSEKFALITPPGPAATPTYLEQLFTYETKIKKGIYGNLIAGDINSDGNSDIIMVEYKHNHIEILTLDSQNRPISAMKFKVFEQKSYRGKKTGKTGVEPRELKIADVTGDGKDDLITVIHDRIIIYPQDI